MDRSEGGRIRLRADRAEVLARFYPGPGGAHRDEQRVVLWENEGGQRVLRIPEELKGGPYVRHLGAALPGDVRWVSRFYVAEGTLIRVGVEDQAVVIYLPPKEEWQGEGVEWVTQPERVGGTWHSRAAEIGCDCTDERSERCTAWKGSSRPDCGCLCHFGGEPPDVCSVCGMGSGDHQPECDWGEPAARNHPGPAGQKDRDLEDEVQARLPKGWKMERREEFHLPPRPEDGIWYLVFSPDHVLQGQARDPIRALGAAMDRLWRVVVGALT